MNDMNNQMMNGQVAGPEAIDLLHYWHVLRRQIFKIIALSAVATVVAVLVVMTMTPVYKATSTLLIESEDAKILSIEEVYGISGQNSEYLQTQFEILKSRELAKRVALELNLIDNQEFNPYHPANKKTVSLGVLKEELWGPSEPPTPEAIEHATIDSFWGAVSVSPIRKTQLVNVSVESQSAELAALAANSMSRAYVESQMEAKVGMTQQAASWLSERLGGLKQKLDDSELRLQKYRDENNLIDVEGVDTLVAKELDEITKRLVEAKARRLEAESVYQQLKSVGEYSYENLSSLPLILSNNFVSRLRENETKAELKVSELSKRYGPLHPKMVAARSDLDAAKESVLAQMKRIANGIEKDYTSARIKERSLQQAMNDKVEDVRDINKVEFKLNEYSREVRANRELYETFFNRIRETTETGDLQTANARITDPAVVPKIPVKPKKSLIVVLVALVSGMFGVGLAFMLDALDATVKNPEDVDRKLGVSLLGMLPLLKNDELQEDRLVRAFAEGSSHGFSESVRTMRTSVTLASLESPVQIVLLTSSVPGEGKTTTSANLAEAFGQMEEKTLLIDADMRRPTMAKKLGLPGGSRGLSNAVAYPETLDECIHHLEELNIDVIPSGPIPPNPLELLGSKNFRAILDTLRGRYQRIVIDSAPMKMVSDALYLSTLVDGVVYIVKADSTRDKLVKDSLIKLDDSNARVLGVALNQLNIDKESKYGYGYGYYAGYYDAYGYTSSEKEYDDKVKS